MPFKVETITRVAGDLVFVAGGAAALFGLHGLAGAHWTLLVGGVLVAAVGFAIGRR